jgi:nicotinamidase/pyrazinamidase
MRDDQEPALLVVAAQNDFCPAVRFRCPNGDQVVPVLNRLARTRVHALGFRSTSRDWHPANSRHFAVNGGEWPCTACRGRRRGCTPIWISAGRA